MTLKVIQSHWYWRQWTHMISYESSSVNISPSCTISEILALISPQILKGHVILNVTLNHMGLP